jgi:thiol-disulfide isomerase/thioredoxin
MTDPILVRGAVVTMVVVVTVLVGWWWRRRDGAVHTASEVTERLDPRHLEAVGLDLRRLSTGAVLLGSPTCAPCETVKEMLGTLVAERVGFDWVYADAAEHLELAGEHRVLRVPTLLMVGDDGAVVARASGVPRPDDLRRVLDERGVELAA